MKKTQLPSVKYLALWIFSLLFPAHVIHSEPITINVARFPVLAESAEKGILIDLLNAISQETNTPINIVVLPISRSILQVQRREVDLHIPAIIPDDPADRGNFHFTNAVLFYNNFILYTNINNDFSVDLLGKKKFDIRSLGPTVRLYGFPTTPTVSSESALTMLTRQRIDGFIISDFSGDTAIHKMKLGNIKRQLFKIYAIGGIVAQGEINGRADRLLQKGIKILKQKGTYSKYLSMYGLPYNDWQPYKGESKP